MASDIKIAVIGDIHYGSSPLEQRHGEYGNVFLLRTIRRLNRFIKPDIVLVLGDLVDSSKDAEVANRYKEISEILEILRCPYIVIPGNHDLPPEMFYQYFPIPDLLTKLNGFGFITFAYDPETEGYNSFRNADEIKRMAEARKSFDGALISIQHTCLAPANKAPCYNYDNSQEIIDSMKDNNIFLSISGHYHKGYELYDFEGLNFVSVAAICEQPYSFWVIDTDGKNITVDKQQLRIPDEYQLSDCHIHTEFAYCGENVDMKKNIELADFFGLRSAGFAEHSGQLYIEKESWKTLDFFYNGLSSCKDARYDMVDKYINRAKGFGICEDRLGLEVDIDSRGDLVLASADRKKAAYIIGSVHFLKVAAKSDFTYDEVCEEFMWQTEKLLECGIDILAHPLRIFKRVGFPIPYELLDSLVDLLGKYKTVVEVNFHTNDPPVEFIQKCLNSNIKLTFGSDSHNLCEIGEFYPHINLLREAGYSGDFSDIIVPFPSLDCKQDK